jgi:hypothetical protein
MNLPHRTSASAIIAILCIHAAAVAESFTTVLEFAPEVSDNGQYLNAEFDFQSRFTSIDSVTLNFTMPQGYQGVAVAGGYFSLVKYLLTSIHEAGVGPHFGYDLGGPPAPPSLGTTTFSIPASSPQQFSFFPPTVSTDPPTYMWPDFLYSGDGSISITDYAMSTSGFGGVPEPVTSSISWLLPGAITDASITVAGTSVPEPPTALVFALGVLIAMPRWRDR